MSVSCVALLSPPLASQIWVVDGPRFGSVREALSLAAMIPDAEHPVSAIDDGPAFAGEGRGGHEVGGCGLRLIFRRATTTFF